MKQWKLLALIIIVFLAAGYLLVIIKPRTFISTAPLLLNQERAATFRSLARSEAVLQSVIDKVPNLPGETRNAKLDWLFDAVAIDAPHKESNVVNLKVRAQNPDQAKAIANVVLEETIQIAKPRPIEEARLNEKLARTEAQLKDAETLLDRLREEATSLMAPNALSGEIATSLTRLLERRDALTEAAVQLRGLLQGNWQDSILRRPNTPDEPQPRGALRLMAIAGVLGLFFSAIICTRNLLRELVKHWLGGSPPTSEASLARCGQGDDSSSSDRPLRSLIDH